MKRLFSVFKNYIRTFLTYVFRLFPINKRKILFSSFYGKFCNDIPKAIYDSLKKDQSLKFVWVVDGEPCVNCDNVKTVKIGSIAHVFHLCTSKIWIDNCRKPVWTRKRKKQFYIQTWHGGLALKKVEKDAAEHLGKTYIRMAKNDSKMADLFLSETEIRTNNYLSSFWYSGKILKGNFLRNEQVDESARTSFLNSLGINSGEKIVLYVPTFRNDNDLSVFIFNYKRLLATLKNRFNSDFCLLIKLHPNLSNFASDFHRPCEKVYDVTGYSDTQSLIKMADVVITDFSGCMFDGFRNEKAVFLFAKDFDLYLSENRSLYFGMNELPATFSKTEDELETNILSFDQEAYLEKVKVFNERIGYYKNDGLKECTNILYEVING